MAQDKSARGAIIAIECPGLFGFQGARIAGFDQTNHKGVGLLHRRVVLAKRPQSVPDESCFRLENAAVPEPRTGELLVRNEWLSVDPYMRGRMSNAKSFIPPVKLGQVMCGATVCEVMESRVAGFNPGEKIMTMDGGWQEYAAIPAETAVRCRQYPVRDPDMLGLLGIPGLAAYFGLLKIGRPKSGETVVISAAAGASGSVAGQIARLMGCRVVGIARGQEKCRAACDFFGLDACVDYTAMDFPQQLANACPRGIDIYFESVGGAVLAAVLPLVNPGARIPVAGLMSACHDEALHQSGRFDVLLKPLEQHPLRPDFRFFIVTEWTREFGSARQQLSSWWRQGEIQTQETVLEGIERGPMALAGLFEGANIGKMLVRI